MSMYVARTLDTYAAAILQLADLRSRSTALSGEIELYRVGSGVDLIFDEQKC